MQPRIVIFAHAPLASALREVALHVWPDCAQSVIAIDVPATEPPEATLARAQATLATSAQTGTSTARGVGAWQPAPLLLLCDLKGATPANVAQQLCAWLNAQSQSQNLPTCAQWICGVNAPMLLRAISYAPQSWNAQTLPDWAARAVEGAVRGVESLPV